MQRNAYFEQLECKAEAQGRAIAIEAPEGTVTYAALNAQANRIAHALISHGIEPGRGDIVGLFMDPSIAYVAGLFGVGKAGGAFLPLAIDLPEKRLAAYLAKARATVVVTDAGHAALLPGHITAIIADSAGLEDLSDTNPGLTVKPADGCYVMFTSGSTGTPKAILGQQRGLTHFLKWEIAEFSLDDSVRCSWLAPVTFDVSLRDMLVPLMAGGTLCIPAPDTRITPHRLVDWIIESRLTLIHCVPTVLRLIIRELESRSPAAPFPHLAHLLVAGEPLFGADVAAWRAVAGTGTGVVNLYGPSETTLAKLFHRVDLLPGDPRRVLPIGKPLPNTAVLILKGIRLCAAGEIGEIHIKTPYRTLGYLNDPALTAEAFIQNPLTPDQPDVIYKTGDLGRYREDGTVECLGRQDNQVKINGIRIELGEIEAALRDLPAIKETVATALPGADQRPMLVAYYTRRDGAAEPLPVEGLRAGLGRVLPPAMQPHLFVPLKDFPKTISGKINRKALPRPEALFHEQHEYVAPETDTETRIARVWADLFGLAKVGITSTFHEFGGDSLKAIRALSLLYREFAVEVTLRDFFAAPTIRDLARVIDQSRAGVKTSIPRVPDAAHYPASPAQSRLWRLDRMGIAPTAYNLAEAFTLEGPVDAYALERAVQTLIARHESLRTTFIEVDGEPRQVVHPVLDWQLERMDVSGDIEARQVAEANHAHLFDLEKGPLLHAVLARLPDGADGFARHLLLFNIHHIVSDVWSLGVMVKELALAYRALTHGVKPAFAPLALHYRDFAAWQATGLSDAAMAEHRAFWLDRLQGPLPVLDLPADRLRPAVQTFNGTTARFILDPELTGRLKELAQARGVSLFVLLTSLTKALLHRHTGQDDIIVGSPVLGRNHPDLEPQIGYYVNTVALRDRVDGARPFAELLAGVARTVAQALAHQDYPFEELVGSLDLQRDMSRSPVFDVMVVVQTFEGIALDLDGARVVPFGREVAWNFSRYDMVFHLQESPDGLALDLNFNTDLFDPDRIGRCGAQFVELARAVTLDPATLVKDLSLLPASEADRLAAFAQGPAARHEGATIPSLFADIAARHPARPALVEAGRSLTYAETLAAIEKLAGGLVARHAIAPGDRVAVLAERSIESMVAMLAVMRAGAVYVPIDPDYPEARIALMRDRAGCRLVLMDQDVAMALAADDSTAALPAVAGSDVAYIIFTSGSTGLPKAVMVEHRGFVNMALGQIDAFGLTAADRVLQFASPSFDASLANAFQALFAGGAVVLPPRGVIDDTARFLAFLADTGTTCVTLPPIYLRALDRAPMPGLKVLITAGEAAPVAELTHYARTCRAFNAYGPTEASVCATIQEIRVEDAARPRLPIGRPLPDTTVYVLDGAMRPAPIGVIGEIFIGGIGVARGYRDDAERTAERFLTHPRTGERLYRTGDLGRWLADGSLDFLGRRDDQVKVAGHRIEMGEVEEALRAVPGVRDAHVATIARADGSTALVGYYCPEKAVELWPSVAEFFVYDDVAYSSMANDEGRNRRYRAVFEKHLPNKTVVDIGTGPFAILSRLAVEAGAARVYAIDLLESSAAKARETVARLGLSDRITVIHGDATTVDLPEKVDVCISEIVGAIGGSEGSAKIINAARRFLKDGAAMLPQRSLTRIAAVSLPEGSFSWGFPDIAAHYVEKIFAEVGRPFDLRLCVKNLIPDAILSTSGPFEDLDYTRDIALEAAHDIDLVVTRGGPLTGLLVWLHLYVDPDHDVDILDNPGSWLPVYLPVFPDGVEVTPGDRIVATVERTLCANGLNPDFTIAGRLVRAHGGDVPFRYASAHFGTGFRTDPFYARLFQEDGVPRRDALAPVVVRRALSRTLPNFAVPAFLVELAALPLTANGKIDRDALPSPTAAPAKTANQPDRALTSGEERVLAVWRQVLERDDIGLEDDFFALGGDSIRAIQIVSRLQQGGMRAEIRDIFQNPTVGQFALVVQAVTVTASQEPVIGEVPLGPIQRWFFDTVTIDSHRFNQAVLLKGGFEPAAVEKALKALWVHHDALRARFTVIADGVRQEFAAPDTPFRFENVAPEDFEAAADRLHDGFDLATGPLFAALLGCDRLLLVAHHLVVDGVSWRVMLEDFQAAYAGAGLPPKTASYRDYAQAMARLATSPELADHAAWWRRIDPAPPLDTGERGTLADSMLISVTLDKATTEALLGPVHAAYRTTMDDVLLAALALALKDTQGRERTMVVLESHGREAPLDGPFPDIGRTVGWFTSIHPFPLEAGTGNPCETLKSVKEALRRVPARGRTFGLLAIEAPPAQISLNYLGNFGAHAGGDRFTVDWDAPGIPHSPRQRRRHALDILALVTDGHLTLSLDYDTTTFAADTAQRLLDGLKTTLNEVIDHCLGRKEGEATPSDFTYDGLSMDQLNALLEDID
ncbi:MAG TPA: amino acid adenylation domain-containing protein [Azospirillaceae bacterium]|nr:amino acid adenylation domain-containing protein [Azospirillaceae bacterium]